MIRINRKGRPFSTCSVCNCTPCEAPEEHAKLKREAEVKSHSSKVEVHHGLHRTHLVFPTKMTVQADVASSELLADPPD